LPSDGRRRVTAEAVEGVRTGLGVVGEAELPLDDIGGLPTECSMAGELAAGPGVADGDC
jgi:hypothetical protein